MPCPAQNAERRRTPAERELHARMRPLARYQSQPAHEVFVEGLALEARLRARILVRPPQRFSQGLARLSSGMRLGRRLLSHVTLYALCPLVKLTITWSFRLSWQWSCELIAMSPESRGAALQPYQFSCTTGMDSGLHCSVANICALASTVPE